MFQLVCEPTSQSPAKALRIAARERNTTATDLVVQGLHHILGQVEGTVRSVESRLHELETQLTTIANRPVESGTDDGSKQRLLQLEQKTEAISQRLAQLEGALAILSKRSSGGSRRQSYNYHPPQLELQAYKGENLAKRLGVSLATLEQELKNQNSKDFENWCRSRDPGSVGWRYGSDGLFHPIK
ncbi:hypothetical protein A6770_39990 [Nostoc minutum NIES-26]|uniref:Uncharacterized protein n=1 Tax=Nostoc minutum NIES-26 TaxID=1844469 RepID=A0A367RQL9_9NOSO|nr:hypothetical protein A6770_39990 [Nostoc minutum NIES-26]